MLKRRADAIIFCCFLAITTPCFSQQTGVFEGETELTVVNFDVFVSDRNGTPVSGLTVEDFLLFENGKAKEITNFYAVQNQLKHQSPQPTVQPEASLSQQRSEPLYIAIVVDEVNTGPMHRKQAMKALVEYVPKLLAEGHRVLLASFTGSVVIYFDFSDPPDQVEAALTAMRDKDDFSIRQARSIQVAADIAFGQMRNPEAIDDGASRRVLEAMRNIDTRITLNGLKAVNSILAGMPGRRAVLFVSNGMYMPKSKFVGLDEVISGANAHAITYYTIDTRGVTRGGTFLDSHLRLAKKTGGRMIAQENKILPAMNGITPDFGSYYSVGYPVEDYESGQELKIEIRVRKLDLEVRHRHTFRYVDMAERMSNRSMSAFHIQQTKNQMGIGLTVEKGPYRRIRSLSLVPVKLLIPLGKVQLSPTASGTASGQVQLFMAAADEDGYYSDVQQMTVPIEVGAAFQGKPAVMYAHPMTLKLRFGQQKVVFGLVDEMTEETSFIVRTIHVPMRGSDWEHLRSGQVGNRW